MIRVTENGWIADGDDDPGLPRDTPVPAGDCLAEIKVGGRTPWMFYACTRNKGHDGPHRAGTGTVIVAVWSD